MTSKGFMSAAAALALIAAPTMASAAQPSINVAPATERVDGDSQLGGGGGFFVAIIAVIAIITGIIIVANEDDSPNSP